MDIIGNGGFQVASIRVGVVGCGNMGKNHLRVLSSMAQYDLVGCYDTNKDESIRQSTIYGIEAFDRLSDLFSSVDLAHVVTPSRTHRDIAIAAAEAGCHVLVEKPIALTIEDSQAIIDACSSANVKLCIGHVERYNPAIEALIDIIRNEDILSIEFHRMSPFDKRVSDSSVVQDLMIHDLDILNHIANSSVQHVTSQGIIAYSDKLDYVQAQVVFENGLLASLVASRITESKVRRADINTRGAYISVDYLNRTVTVSRKTEFLQGNGLTQQYRQDNVIERVYVPTVEPLHAEFLHFAESIMHDDAVLTSGEAGMMALSLSKAIEQAAKVTIR